MRYASEFFADLATGRRKRRYDEFNASLEDLQDNLGRLNDIWVGQEIAHLALDDAGSAKGEGADFAAGVVVGRTMAKTSLLIKAARLAGRAFLDTRPWW